MPFAGQANGRSEEGQRSGYRVEIAGGFFRVFGFVVHAILLHPDYAALPNVFRSDEEGMNFFHWMLLAHLMIGFALTWIYRQGVQAGTVYFDRLGGRISFPGRRRVARTLHDVQPYSVERSRSGVPQYAHRPEASPASLANATKRSSPPSPAAWTARRKSRAHAVERRGLCLSGSRRD